MSENATIVLRCYVDSVSNIDDSMMLSAIDSVLKTRYDEGYSVRLDADNLVVNIDKGFYSDLESKINAKVSDVKLIIECKSYVKTWVHKGTKVKARFLYQGEFDQEELDILAAYMAHDNDVRNMVGIFRQLKTADPSIGLIYGKLNEIDLHTTGHMTVLHQSLWIVDEQDIDNIYYQRIEKITLNAFWVNLLFWLLGPAIVMEAKRSFAEYCKNIRIFRHPVLISWSLVECLNSVLAIVCCYTLFSCINWLTRDCGVLSWIVALFTFATTGPIPIVLSALF